MNKTCKQCGTTYRHFGPSTRLCRDCWLPVHREQVKRYNDRHREEIRANRRMWDRKTWKLYRLYIAEHPEAKRRFLPDQGQLRIAYVRECARAYLAEHPNVGKSIGRANV